MRYRLPLSLRDESTHQLPRGAAMRWLSPILATTTMALASALTLFAERHYWSGIQAECLLAILVALLATALVFKGLHAGRADRRFVAAGTCAIATGILSGYHEYPFPHYGLTGALLGLGVIAWSAAGFDERPQWLAIAFAFVTGTTLLVQQFVNGAVRLEGLAFALSALAAAALVVAGRARFYTGCLLCGVLSVLIGIHCAAYGETTYALATSISFLGLSWMLLAHLDRGPWLLGFAALFLLACAPVG